jgi:hypothetical protein
VKPGTIVIYPADPLLYGKLIVIGTAGDGRLECEQVHAEELEAFDLWTAGRVAA